MMEYESDFMQVFCGICGKSGAKSLVTEEQELLQRLFRCISLREPSPSACQLCLRKLYSFKQYLREIFINQVKLARSHARNMDNKKPEETHKNGINCKCFECQEKYGSLPLLVEVIEKKEKTEESLQPSTSYNSSPKASQKVMKCTHCLKSFTHKGDLNKHLRKHTGEQPFACSSCGKKFGNTSNLARHMRLHSGDRPFRCEFCNKDFSRKDKFDIHLKTCKK